MRVRLDEVVGDAAIRLPDPRRFGAQVGGAHAQMGRMRADFERTFGAIRRSHADWLLAGWEGTVRDEDELRASGRLDERERFGAYLRAVACAAIFHEWPHHQTASGFMAASRIANSSEHVSTIGPRQLGANGCGRMIARPAPSIDVLLRQESFVMDMHALGERLGINMTRCPVGHSKDALERFNRYRARRRRLALVRSANSDSPGHPRLLARTNTLAVGRNAHGFPSKVALHGFLEEDPRYTEPPMRMRCLTGNRSDARPAKKTRGEERPPSLALAFGGKFNDPAQPAPCRSGSRARARRRSAKR